MNPLIDVTSPLQNNLHRRKSPKKRRNNEKVRMSALTRISEDNNGSAILGMGLRPAAVMQSVNMNSHRS